jgi:hypothetical protein
MSEILNGERKCDKDLYSMEQATKPSTPYVKILREDMIHRGFQYTMGINVDRKSFNPIGMCKFGGLYFCTRANDPLFAGHGRLIVDVVLPPNEPVYEEIDKLKARCIVLSNPRPWEEVFSEFEKQVAVCVNPSCIAFLLHPSLTVQNIAVEEDAHVIQFIRHAGENVKRRAIQKDPLSIEHMRHPSLALQYLAVSLNRQAIHYIQDSQQDMFFLHNPLPNNHQ